MNAREQANATTTASEKEPVVAGSTWSPFALARSAKEAIVKRYNQARDAAARIITAPIDLAVDKVTDSVMKRAKATIEAANTDEIAAVVGVVAGKVIGGVTESARTVATEVTDEASKVMTDLGKKLESSVSDLGSKTKVAANILGEKADATFKEIRKQAEASVNDLGSQVKSSVEDAGSKLRAGIEETGSKLTASVERGMDKVRNMGGSILSSIKNVALRFMTAIFVAPFNWLMGLMKSIGKFFDGIFGGSSNGPSTTKTPTPTPEPTLSRRPSLESIDLSRDLSWKKVNANSPRASSVNACMYSSLPMNTAAASREGQANDLGLEEKGVQRPCV